ncbi:unnamed protein product, partial [marine sediment metagenome]
MSDEIIDRFFEKKLITSSNTQKSYKCSILKFFSLINKDINTYFDNNKTLDDYENDLNKAYMKLDKQNV